MLAWSRRRKWSVPAVRTVFTILIFQTVCGNKSGGSVTPPPSGTTKTPAGTYSLVVAATANGITHDAKVTVVVQ
jgi:hypothetical protein